MAERRPHIHEMTQGGFATLLCFWLAVVAGPLHFATLLYGAIAMAQVAIVLALARVESEAWQRVRLATAYFIALASFRFIAFAVPALHLTLRDEPLLEIDRAMFGETPAVLLQPLVHPWLTDLMSAFYLSYHLYFSGVLIHALFLPLPKGSRIFETMFTALPFGLAGYLAVPALGPMVTLADRIGGDLAAGPITAFCTSLVHGAGAVYDAFPSLHVFMTLVILEHDRRHHPLRFRLCLPIAIGLFASTLYLRYHYAVDLIGGAVWFAAHRSWMVWRESRQPLGDRVAVA